MSNSLLRLYVRYYATILNNQGLSYELSNFPNYTLKTTKKFNQERLLINNNTVENCNYDEHELIDKTDCRVTIMNDGSIIEICTLGTTPNRTYHCSLQKRQSLPSQTEYLFRL